MSEAIVEIVKRRQANGWAPDWNEVILLTERIRELEAENAKPCPHCGGINGLHKMALGVEEFSEIQKLREGLQQVYIESGLPTCCSYDLDPTPTGEERLATIRIKVAELLK